MTEALKLILDWLSANWGWVIAISSVLFEITPIKFNPISFICNWVGKRITAGIKNDIDELKRNTDAQYDELKNEISTTQKAVDMQRIANIKSIILDFANSCRNGRKHSKEEFTYILSENNEYEELIKKYHLINNVYTEDFAYIKEIYRECMRENKFLA